MNRSDIWEDDGIGSDRNLFFYVDNGCIGRICLI